MSVCSHLVVGSSVTHNSVEPCCFWWITVVCLQEKSQTPSQSLRGHPASLPTVRVIHNDRLTSYNHPELKSNTVRFTLWSLDRLHSSLFRLIRYSESFRESFVHESDSNSALFVQNSRLILIFTFFHTFENCKLRKWYFEYFLLLLKLSSVILTSAVTLIHIYVSLEHSYIYQ